MTPRDYLRKPYARVVIPDESGGYYAEILEFPGCFADGSTVEQAYEELENAAESWIEVRLSLGQEVPKPFSNLDYSGTISLRLPRSVHKRAAIMAERDRTSLNTFLVSAVAERVGAEDLYNIIAKRLEQRLSQAAFEAYVHATSLTGRKKVLRPLHIDNTADTASPELEAVPLRS